MTQRNVHLVCHSHIDPVWLWQWEEGLAVALSTFRTAADFCEEHEGFIFNHNEALLYMWAEEHEPELFERIKRLVERGQWRVMGGWYLQPDCNMPSGESFVRQILVGKNYFKEKFGVESQAAFNIDSFGTSRGLVQIMAKSGHKYYVHGRPGQDDCPLPANHYVWVGFDGSEIVATRPIGAGTALGAARGKVEGDLKAALESDLPFLAGWGLGDHGGGPTRKDYAELVALMAETTQVNLFESSLDAYFEELSQWRDSLPRYEGDLNAWAIGCYTSQVRIKQKHRLLENELFAAEKMASACAVQGLAQYPASELRSALLDLLFCEFHDILPGSSIKAAEDDAIRTLEHGLEIANRVKVKSFFALAAGQEKAKNNQLPIFVYNPHPFPVKAIVECDFALPDDIARVDDSFVRTPVYQNGKYIPSQSEKEPCNIPEQWRKRVVFLAELEPSRMNRFDCGHEVLLTGRPEFGLKPEGAAITFKNPDMEVVISTKTGLVDAYRVGGVDYVGKDCFAPLVMMDDDDPWGMKKRAIREVAGKFELMTEEAGTRFSAVNSPIPSVRVVEDGDVRSVVEAVFEYGDSTICQRYLLPKSGSEVEVQLQVFWREAYRALKVSIPTATGEGSRYLGQVAYGVQELPVNGNEAVAQKWTAVVSEGEQRALTCINDGIYGSDFSEDGLRLTLLRSPAYSAHPIGERVTVWQDRYEQRIDQGDRSFRFWINAGAASERLEAVDREAIVKNEKPMAVQAFPSGLGEKPQPFVILAGDTVQMPAVKMSEDGGDLIIRLFEPTGNKRDVELSIPCLGLKQSVTLAPFEIKTLRVDRKTGTTTETDLLERPVG